MISEVRKKIARELTLVLAERGRADETALPTDLWKKPVRNSYKSCHAVKFGIRGRS